MYKFTYLFTAEDVTGKVFVFQAENACSAKPGDLILYDGYLFTIRKTNHIVVDSDDYAMIADITEIRDAEAIYSSCWQKKEKETDEDS